MIYLGYWGGEYIYQPTGKLPTRFPPPQVFKCACCKIRWFRAITNFYDGMCYYCWLEQFEGEKEMVL